MSGFGLYNLVSFDQCQVRLHTRLLCCLDPSSQLRKLPDNAPHHNLSLLLAKLCLSIFRDKLSLETCNEVSNIRLVTCTG